MRFFSNDARESSDEPAQDDGPDRVRSEPVAVPHQRPPSPWSNTPPTAADGTVAPEADRRDDVAPDAGVVPDRADTDPPPFHEPSPQPTAFGASTVGGAVAASAMANPTNDRWNATDREAAADTGVGDDANVAPGDGVVTSSTGTYAGGTVTAPEAVPATWTGDSRDEHRRDDPDGVVDLPLDDQTDPAPAGAVSARSGDVPGSSPADLDRDDSVTTFDDPAPAAHRDDDPASAALKDEGGFDDPRAVDPATGKPLDSSTPDDDSRSAAKPSAPDATVGSTPLKDEGGFDDPKAVDPATDTPLDTSPAPAVAVPAAAAGPAASGTATPEAGSLFDRDDAQAFQERWRDVQLRFVDSPKDAAGDAAKLVDEAVEKLSASLRSQRAALDNDTDDTEQLRVQLRGYRDMLNRILSL